MSNPELVVKGKILLDDEIQNVCIGIDDGKITALGKDLDSAKTLDFGSCVIIPGGVDVHTHMREPGLTHKEDFYTGTLSAAFGGTTTILDMPNTDPPTNSRWDIEEKMELASSKCNVDFGLYANLGPDSDIQSLSAAAGFKIFMSGSTNAAPISQDDIERIFRNPQLKDRVVVVHAEDPLLFEDNEVTSLVEHDAWRNEAAENSAILFLNSLDTPAILHTAHVTNPKGIELADRMSTEVSPHHLFLNTEFDIRNFAKVFPPVRSEITRSKLFHAFREGRIGIVASDHAPHTLAEKSVDFSETPGGLPGAETRMPMMMQLVKDRHLPLSLVQECCCRNPARLFGMNKGLIEVGYDADLAVYDMHDSTMIKAEKLHSKCGWTPFENFNGIFPKLVMLRGEIIVSDGEVELERSGERVSQQLRQSEG